MPNKEADSIVQKNVREKPVVQKNFRPIEPIRKEPPTSPEYVEATIERKIQLLPRHRPEYYLGFGGTGDAMLVLAAAYANPKRHVIFFGNPTSITLIKDMFCTFDTSATVMPNIMGKPLANIVFAKLNKAGTIKESAHLADGLYYEDWRNEDKYIKRIVNHIPQWRSKFGLLDKKLVVIAPSGSNRDPNRQRYLSKKEYETIVRNYLGQGYEVYGIGSDRDWREYAIFEEGVWWATNRILRNWQGKSKNHKLADMLKIINSATEVISMDTWLKTYSLIAGMPTTVIATRWGGAYKPYGEDVTDWIFLNSKIWPTLKVVRVEELI
jgi:hypothetical protein